jgi:hypothetical protein
MWKSPRGPFFAATLALAIAGLGYLGIPPGYQDAYIAGWRVYFWSVVSARFFEWSRRLRGISGDRQGVAVFSHEF